MPVLKNKIVLASYFRCLFLIIKENMSNIVASIHIIYKFLKSLNIHRKKNIQKSGLEFIF